VPVGAKALTGDESPQPPTSRSTGGRSRRYAASRDGGIRSARATLTSGRRITTTTARRVPGALGRAVRHPGWLAEQGRSAIRRGRTPGPPLGDEDLEYLTDDAAVMADLFDVPAADYRSLLAGRRRPRSPAGFPDHWGARETLLNLVHAIVHLLRPQVMVETGVAAGLTSSVALAAMRDNGAGHLYSIDLPPLAVKRDDVGRVVPPELRERWTLELGPSRKLLPRVLRQTAPIDLFLADADHAYSAQLEEYRTAFPALRSGGVLLSDDVANVAFVEFAAEVGARPYLIRNAPAEVRPSNVIGMIRK
jgi:predicted O-methyltransferase YrrM